MSCNNKDFRIRANHRITIQEPVYTNDSLGGRDLIGWNDLHTVWAVIEPKQGSERSISKQKVSEQKYTILIRYIPGLQNTRVSTTYRINNNNKLLQITGINSLANNLLDQGSQYQEIDCIEIGTNI